MKYTVRIFSILFFTYFFHVKFSLHCSAMEAEDEREDKTVRILSIDAGRGNSGAFSTYLLSYWENELEREFQRRVPISECFDIIAGSSLGGIIALALTSKENETDQFPKNAAKEVMEFCKKNGKLICPVSLINGEENFWASIAPFFSLMNPSYDSKPVEILLEKYFKESSLSSAFPQVIISSYEMRSNMPFIFKSMDARGNPSKNFLIRDIARATSATPSYFSAALITGNDNTSYSFLDGGLFAPDPAVLAFEEARKRFPKAKKFVVVSLGMGEQPASSISSSLVNAGVIAWLGPLIDLLRNVNQKITKDSLMASASMYSGMIGGNFEYFRIPLILNTFVDNGVDNIIGAARRAIDNNPDILKITNHLKEYISLQGYQKISSIGDEHIQNLKLLIQIESEEKVLNLEKQGITNRNLSLLKNMLKNNQTLTEINLSYNKIDSDSAQILKSILDKNPHITRLILDHNDFGTKGVQPLETYFKEAKLNFLSLRHTSLTDSDVKPLIRMLLDNDSLNICIAENNINTLQSHQLLKMWFENNRIKEKI